LKFSEQKQLSTELCRLGGNFVGVRSNGAGCTGAGCTSALHVILGHVLILWRSLRKALSSRYIKFITQSSDPPKTWLCDSVAPISIFSYLTDSDPRTWKGWTVRGIHNVRPGAIAAIQLQIQFSPGAAPRRWPTVRAVHSQRPAWCYSCYSASADGHWCYITLIEKEPMMLIQQLPRADRNDLGSCRCAPGG